MFTCFFLYVILPIWTVGYQAGQLPGSEIAEAGVIQYFRNVYLPQEYKLFSAFYPANYLGGKKNDIVIAHPNAKRANKIVPLIVDHHDFVNSHFMEVKQKVDKLFYNTCFH